jgi:WD40 repeat protein
MRPYMPGIPFASLWSIAMTGRRPIVFGLLLALWVATLLTADQPSAKGQQGEKTDGKDVPLPAGAKARLEHKGGNQAVAFSPDGKILASGGDGIYLWDPATWKLFRRLEQRGVQALAFAPPDGKMLAAGGHGTVVLWDLASGKELRRFKAGVGTSLAFSPDGKVLATSDGRLWDPGTTKEVRQLTGGQGAVGAGLTLSRDGKLLATGGEKAICLWDAEGKELSQAAAGPIEWVDRRALAFSPDGTTLVTGWDRGIGLYETTGGKLRSKKLLLSEARHEVLSAEFGWRVKTVAFSPDGSILAVHLTRTDGGGQLYVGMLLLLDPATGELRSEHVTTNKYQVNGGIAFAPDGRTLVSADQGGVLVWEVAQAGQPKPVGRMLRGEGFIFSPNSKTLLTGHRLWEVPSGKPLAVEGWDGARYSPDGGVVAAWGANGRVVLWDIATAQPEARLENEPLTNEPVFAPDGKTVAVVTGAKAATVSLWETATGKQLGKPDQGGQVYWLAFSKDGKFLATLRDDGIVRLHQTMTGREVLKADLLTAKGGRGAEELKGFRDLFKENPIVALAMRGMPMQAYLETIERDWAQFTSDGNTLVLVDLELDVNSRRNVRLYDLVTEKDRARLTLPPNLIVYSVFVPDNRTLAALVGTPLQFRLWDLTTGKERIEIVPPDFKVVTTKDGFFRQWQPAYAFAPDGKTLATASADKTVRVWDLATGKDSLKLSGHKDPPPIARLVYAPGGKVLAARGQAAPDLLQPVESDWLRLWNLTTGGEVLMLSSQAYSFAFSPDGRTVAVGQEKAVKLWDTFTGKELLTLPEYERRVDFVAFSPDGKVLATGTKESGTSLFLWDVGRVTGR